MVTYPQKRDLGLCKWKIGVEEKLILIPKRIYENEKVAVSRKSERLVQTGKKSMTGRSHIFKHLHNIPRMSDAKNTRICTRDKNTWAQHQQPQICKWQWPNWEKLDMLQESLYMLTKTAIEYRLEVNIN